MAFNAERFVIIDGVQYSKERAERLGLLQAATAKDAPQRPVVRAPHTRARTADSAGKKTPPATDA